MEVVAARCVEGTRSGEAVDADVKCGMGLSSEMEVGSGRVLALQLELLVADSRRQQQQRQGP